ncbi:MAG: pstA, partial [Proteobacteria bacterium]|nr:pstA [Pseudomonadota bacterium]
MNSSNRSLRPPSEGSRIQEVVRAGLARRRAAEARFRIYGIVSIAVGLVFLVVLFSSIIANGYPAFQQTYIALDVEFDAAKLDPEGKRDREALAAADYA